MRDVRKILLAIRLVVVSGFGLLGMNIAFAIPTATAMPWNERIFDAVGSTSEHGLLKEVRSRGSVRNSGGRSSSGRSSSR